MTDHPLGPVRFSGTRSRREGRVWGVLGGLLLLVAVLSLAGGAFVGLLGFAGSLTSKSPNVAAAGLSVVLFGGGGLCGSLALALPGVLLWRKGKANASNTWQESIEVREGGLVLTERSGARTLLWDEVVGFRRPPPRGRLMGMALNVPYSFFSVEGPPGQRFQAAGMPDLEAMGTFVEQQVIPRRLARASAALARGETVRFGDVVVSPSGISGFSVIGPTKWANFEGFGMGKHHQLAIKERGNPFLLNGPLYIDVPDVAALMALAAQRRSAAP